MIRLLVRIFSVARNSIGNHGGGYSGFKSFLSRASKIYRTLGWKALTQRLMAAERQLSEPSAPHFDFVFPAPSPLSEVTLRVGVMAHVYYSDLIEEFSRDLSHLPVPFVLMVSVMDDEARTRAIKSFSTLGQAKELHVRIVPNRGRDIAPLLITFREEILSLDVVAHIHTKKSLYTGSEKENWRRYLTGSLLGSRSRVAWILGMFQAAPQLGMIYPESFPSVPLAAHTWLSNLEHARELGARLGLPIDGNAYLDFPAGSMFWSRVDCLRPLYDLGIKLDDFPEEQGQTDGTLQHALERMFVQVARQEQLLIGVLPFDGSQRLSSEGARNWESHFLTPANEKIAFGAIDAAVVSFDVFDTLVVRPFLHASGSRTYLADLARRRLGVQDFQVLRERAETSARNAAMQDVDSSLIYRELARQTGMDAGTVDALHRLELETEHRQFRPRQAIVEIAARLKRSGKRIVAISDMYLSQANLKRILPGEIRELAEQIYVSCDTGWRKDTGEAWNRIPPQLGVVPGNWLHVGDNEHSDIQLPYQLGFLPPVHVLRPASLLEVVPALRRLRPNRAQSAQWPNQLFLGLVANRLSELADRTPAAFGRHLTFDAPEDVGYVVFGPLIFDYLAWISRMALAEGIDKVLFLSREGFLLEKAFKRIRSHVPELSSVDGVYLLASRRGIGTPMLRELSDIDHLLGSTFSGSLYDLLDARMGTPIADHTSSVIGAEAMAAEIYLPEMRSRVLSKLAPAADGILAIARAEREAYGKYWASEVGGRSALISDLGYAGTIQAHLARLTGMQLKGAYFALRQGADQVRINDGWAKARFHDERDKSTLSQASPILQNDLLLESVLTSADGQFSHFEDGSAALRPVFAADTLDPGAFATISRIHAGVETFMEDIGNAVGGDCLSAEFDRTLVQQPLHCLGTGMWRAGTWAQDLTLSDTYTGRGSISVAQ